MDTLDKIAIKVGTDKSSLVHSYTQHYEKYLESLRENPLKLLEIGVQSGASLRMWKQYLPNAQIYGYDFYNCTPYEEERIRVFQGAQHDLLALERMDKEAGKFDVIIDDGSHKNADILTCFYYLFPRMTPGGLYVIEDFNVCYWGETHNVGAPTAIERMKKLVDDVNAGGKTGIGDPKKDQKDATFQEQGMGKTTWWEKNVAFVHFYRGLVFIGKQELLY